MDEMNENKYVTLTQLASELGLDRSNMRKYVLKHGFSPVRIRTPRSRGQLTLALTLDEAETIRELRQSQGFVKSQPVENSTGYFYIIQLIPEFAPNRVKLGFASDVQARLSTHRTSAPTARLVKFWPCKRSWESTAIASMTRIECELIAGEVFECRSLAGLIARSDEFFAILPSI